MWKAINRFKLGLIIFVILFQVVSFGWLSLVVSRIYLSKFALFAEDAVKMSETHGDVCKAILALYFIKIHIIPQFYYLICTLGSKQQASNIKQETPEETNKQSELCDDYSDDQLPKYSSLSLAASSQGSFPKNL